MIGLPFSEPLPCKILKYLYLLPLVQCHKNSYSIDTGTSITPNLSKEVSLQSHEKMVDMTLWKTNILDVKWCDKRCGIFVHKLIWHCLRINWQINGRFNPCNVHKVIIIRRKLTRVMRFSIHHLMLVLACCISSYAETHSFKINSCGNIWLCCYPVHKHEL